MNNLLYLKTTYLIATTKKLSKFSFKIVKQILKFKKLDFKKWENEDDLDLLQSCKHNHLY